MDKKGRSIPYAAIQNNTTGKGINTDLHGYYRFSTLCPSKFSAFALGYKMEQLEIDNCESDTVELDFYLEENLTELETITVSATHPPRLIAHGENLMDFEISSSRLWLLHSRQNKSILSLCDTNAHKISAIDIKGHLQGDSIGQEVSGYIAGVNGDSTLFFSTDSTDNIHVSSYPSVYYNSRMSNVVAYRRPFYYQMSYDSMDSRVNYTCLNSLNGTKTNFYSYMDVKTFIANSILEEKMLVLDLMVYSNDTNYDDMKRKLIRAYKEDGLSDQEIENAEVYVMPYEGLGYFPDAIEKILTKLEGAENKIFSMLRIAKDTIYVFNYTANTMSVYDLSNRFIRTVPFQLHIHYGFDWHPINHRKLDVLVDKEKQELYLTFRRNRYTYLDKIDLTTGKMYYQVKLDYPFIQKIRISNGVAYFSWFDTSKRKLVNGGELCIFKKQLQ